MNRVRVQLFAAARIIGKVIQDVIPIGQQIEQLQLGHPARQANRHR